MWIGAVNPKNGENYGPKTIIYRHQGDSWIGDCAAHTWFAEGGPILATIYPILATWLPRCGVIVANHGDTTFKTRMQGENA